MFQTYIPQINSYAKQLRNEGVWSTNLASLFDETRQHAATGELLGKIAVELDKLAGQLPKNDENH